MSPFTREVPAHEGETVEIVWRCDDGSLFHQYVTLPAKAIRDVLVATDRNAAGQVTDRLSSNDAGQRFART